MYPLLGAPAIYRITIQGRLDSSWSNSFEGMVISNEVAADGTPLSVLTGRLVDQAALLGILNGLYGLGFPLLSVERLEINSAT